MQNSNSLSFNCSNCPFDGQDCVYCRTCKHCDHEKHAHNRKKSPAQIHRWLRRRLNYYRVSFGYGWGVWVKRWFVERAPHRLNTKPTHNISAARVGCVGGDRRLPANPATIKRQSAKPLCPLAPHKANAQKNYRPRLSFAIYSYLCQSKGGVTYEYRRKTNQA